MSLRVRFVPPKVDARAVLAAAVPAAETAGAEVLLEKSRPLVPVESGRLADSGHIEVDGDRVGVAYEAWNFDEAPPYPYGIRIHEDLDLHHPNGGQAKFLEMPMHNEHEAIRAAVIAKLAEALGLG